MDLTSGQPFWLAKNGFRNQYEALRDSTRCEVLIIGGGISGALMLYSLIGAGIDAVLVDKRRFGTGSTCASTALLQYQVDVPLTTLQKKIGVENANKAYKDCAYAVDRIEAIAADIGFEGIHPRPTLYKAADSRGAKLIESEYKLHESLGFNVELYDASEIKSKFGFEAPLGLFSNHSAETDAYAFMHHLLDWCTQRGARVYQFTEILKLKSTKTGVEAITQYTSKIKASKVIYATGYEIDEKLYRDIVNLQTTFAYITTPCGVKEPWYRNSLIWDTASPYHYLRTTSAGGIIVGGEDIRGNDPKRRERLLDRKVRKLEKHFVKLFPNLNVTVEFKWAGTFGSTRDGLPYIGTIGGEPNIFYSLGFGGNGITFSVLASEIIRDMIKGSTPPNADLYKFDR